LSGCGWHLRGTAGATLPSSLATLRVTMSGGEGDYDPLLIAVREALQVQGGAKVTEGKDLPTLHLYNEVVGNRVLSVDTTGKVREYMLRYEVNFRVTDAAGNELAPAQTVVMQRAVTFDRLHVLAKEREERELLVELKRDAAQQVLQRLAQLGAAA
jgi:LPS-assembly lipoprotein